ncbi:hypothetical protein GW17_00051123 [Ensete ventricosum]|nr:hypothetical protein GW17_00051123 [Ensete ventricosum]
MADVSSALQTTLHMREGSTASTTTSSFSKRRETTANLRTAKRRFHARQQPAQKHLRRDQIKFQSFVCYPTGSSLYEWCPFSCSLLLMQYRP